MPDQSVTLADAEWTQVLAILANATGPGINWSVVNPLVMRIGDQLRLQASQGPAGGTSLARGDGLLSADQDAPERGRRPRQ